MSRTEAKQWLADALGKSGEAAEHVVFYRGRHAGLEPRQLRAAKRELGVTDYQGGPEAVCGDCRTHNLPPQAAGHSRRNREPWVKPIP